MSAASPARLSYDVFVSDGPARAGDERMPDGAPLAWSPLSSTLIFGAHDAVLVDPPFTRTQIQADGDVAYNGVHQYILEGGHGGLQEWLRALDRVAGLHPRAVVAGHKNKNRPNDPAILHETRQYLQDVIRLLADKPAAREFYDQMTGLYPDRLNPGVVWLGARGLLGS
jgi:hypothetical protein